MITIFLNFSFLKQNNMIFSFMENCIFYIIVKQNNTSLILSKNWDLQYVWLEGGRMDGLIRKEGGMRDGEDSNSPLCCLVKFGKREVNSPSYRDLITNLSYYWLLLLIN